MRIVDMDKARMVMAIKRSMSPGLAGAGNDLCEMDRTLLLFGDAKAFMTETVKELPAPVNARFALPVQLWGTCGPRGTPLVPLPPHRHQPSNRFLAPSRKLLLRRPAAPAP